jgi:hypothetical protein
MQLKTMDKKVIREDSQCRICGSGNLTTVLRLNDTPLEDQFVSDVNKNVLQPVYPLQVALCGDCGYVFLPNIVSPEASYADYIYESGVTVGLRNHYDEYAKEIVADYVIQPDSLVVDLGSNDGSMLASFKKIGMKVVGVEPAKGIAKKATESGIYTINDFFTDKVVSQIRAGYGLASVVTANYMYANIDDVLTFTKAVSKLLTPEGVFVVQTGYHPEQFKTKMFDYIYHEHFSYFTVEVLQRIFSSCDFELIQAVKTSPKGGSLRVVGKLKNGNRKIDTSISKLIDEEKTIGVREEAYYQNFSNVINVAKSNLIDLLAQLRSSGKKIVGLGASHSTTTLTYHFELAPFLEYIVDDNTLKHGRYSPGYHIPVYSTKKLYEADAPEYVIILAWQHQNSILQKHDAFLNKGGKFIIPLPESKILSNDGK